MSTIVIDLRSDSSDTEASLDRVTSKLAGLKTGLGKVDTASKKATNSSVGMKDKLGGLKAAAEGVGGSLGGAAGQLEKFAQAGALLGPVAIVAGVAALAIAGIGLAAIKAGQAFVSMTREAGESIKKLDGFEGLLEISDDTIASIDAANASLDAIGVVMGVVKAQIVELGLGDIFKDLSKLILIFALASSDVISQFGTVIIDTFEDAVNNALIPFRGELIKAAKAYIGLAEVLGLPLPGLEKVRDFLEFAEDVSVFKAMRSGLTGLISVSGKYGDQADAIIDKMTEMNKQGKKSVEVDEERVGVIGEVTDAIVEEKESLVDLYEFQLYKENQIAEVQRDRLSFQMNAVRTINDLVQTGAKSLEDIANRAFKDEEKRAKAVKGIRIAAFIADRAAALTMIAINTAVAISKAAAQTGVGFVATTPMLLGLGAAQAATVLASPIPQFPHGGIVPSSVLAADHGLISAQPGEGVVNKRGMRNIGKDGLDNLNNGSSQGNMVVVQNVYKHRVFDSFVQDNIRKGGPLSDALQTRRVGQR